MSIHAILPDRRKDTAAYASSSFFTCQRAASKMQFPKTTAPQSGFTRLEPPACQGNIGAASSWQRRDEPDLGSFGQLVNPVFREFRKPGRPSSEDETSAEQLFVPTCVRPMSPLSEEVVAPSAFSGGVDGRVIGPGPSGCQLACESFLTPPREARSEGASKPLPCTGFTVPCLTADTVPEEAALSECASP
jgi:hypothetical protein